MYPDDTYNNGNCKIMLGAAHSKLVLGKPLSRSLTPCVPLSYEEDFFIVHVAQIGTLGFAEVK